MVICVGFCAEESFLNWLVRFKIGKLRHYIGMYDE